MSCYVRPKFPGATIFFTVNIAQRDGDLLVHHVETLRDAVRRTLSERLFYIDAWVVLPDHMHAVWTLPPGDSDYATRWRLIKARFSRHVPKGRLRPSHIARRERGVWQRRFWEHHVRDQRDYAAAVRYCHMNPVKHGFVARAKDWPFSSVHGEIAAGRWAQGARLPRTFVVSGVGRWCAETAHATG
ncbi:REP-associated tyrosine transposase [Shimia sp. MMG029]|uniref:REP-associated tyrosine transposase n=1 Tax=Shimia sp. MMG029 TaxID=3021978 RepID=UPI0022FEA4D9|nr:transposase [Shimia sp. MMG029]MDA5558485.1 transposase [Shimia sp. MMG029]